VLADLQVCTLIYFGFGKSCGANEAYVHDAGVDVAKLLEAEEPRAVCRVIEGEAGACVDGDGASIRGWINLRS
jgi:hypothetical protein